MKNKFLIFFIFFSILCSTSSCVVTPSSGQREISLISEEEEKSIGKREHPKIIKQFGGGYIEMRSYKITLRVWGNF